MKKIFATLIIIVIYVFYLMSNCTSKDFKPPLPCANNSTPLNFINIDDTLKIIIEASECGEWGGHREYIFLKRKNNKITANFIVDSVSCDDIVTIYEQDYSFSEIDENSRKIIIDTTKLLTKKEEKIMNKFILQIMSLYMEQEVFSNAGTVYQIINTDSSLNIAYWNSGDCRNTNYREVRKKVFGEFLK